MRERTTLPCLGVLAVLSAGSAAAGPCGDLGPYRLCAEAGEVCAVVAMAAGGTVTRHPVDLPHPQACALTGGTALRVVEVCGGLPAALVASPVPLVELGEEIGGGFTHRQAEALVLAGRDGRLRIGTVGLGAASRGAAIHAPDPKHLQISAHAQGFCAE